MCMASVERQPIDTASPSKKHPRDDDPPHLSPEPLLKRPCPDLDPSDVNPSNFGFLEELYEFENSLDASAIESVTQEELLTEMMKSLERVIGSIDENPPPQLPAINESSQLLHSYLVEGSEVEDLPAATNCSSDLDLHSGLLVGSPPSPISPAEKLARSVGDDWPSLDVSYAEFEACSSVSQSEVWLNGNFGRLEDTLADGSRDNCDLISLDSVF